MCLGPTENENHCTQTRSRGLAGQFWEGPVKQTAVQLPRVSERAEAEKCTAVVTHIPLGAR